jgi:hypothetical protein
MKQLFTVYIFFVSGLLTCRAQSVDPVSLIANKLIKAIDLKVQAMQNAVMDLQIAQRRAENELSRRELGEIGAWTQKQKELYITYYTSLKQVNPSILNTRALSAVFERQKQLVALYNEAIAANRQDRHLTALEKTQTNLGYNTILADAGRIINKLSEYLKPNNIQATDAERVKFISQSANQLEQLHAKLKVLYSGNMETSLQRVKDENEMQVIKKLYGLQ